jgi:hypothetical protein
MVVSLLLPLSLGISAALAAVTAPAGAAPLRNVIIPHRAIYDIGLERTDEGSGVSSASGRMVFEITGSACEGYKMRQRMVVNIGDEEGNIGLLDFQISTFESGDGGQYNFDSRTKVNAAVVESVEGEARRQGTAIEVKLKQPSEKTVKLDGAALFPSQHLQAIIDAANAEQNFLAVQLYEGAGTGEASDSVAAVIGDSRAGGGGLLVSGVRHWPVSIGYFDEASGDSPALGEELPSYQMSFTLYENGVTNNLIMDYGDYALSGSLTEIEPLVAADCRPR